MIDRLTNIADAVATGVSRRRFFAQVSACGAGLAALLSGSKVGAQNPHQVKITSDLYNVTFQPLFGTAEPITPTTTVSSMPGGTLQGLFDFHSGGDVPQFDLAWEVEGRDRERNKVSFATGINRLN